MSCEHPLLAVNLGKFDGKYKIKILPCNRSLGHSVSNIKDAEARYGYDNVLLLPCGCCPACKAAHQKQWAVRCSLESSYYKDNCMVTLTYEERLRPSKLIKRDLQAFIKKCRNRGIKFRYFACGEYGQGSNPHYHLIMFGFWPSDAKYSFTSKSGFPVYTSVSLSDIWKRGFVTVSEMSPGTAAYVAGYVDKKIGQDEFLLMSTRPGIGERYFREHLFDIYKYDNIVGAFGVAKVPRYCDKIADYMWYDLEDLKKKRKESSNLNLIQSMLAHGFENKEDSIFYEGKVASEKKVRSIKRL